MRQANNGKCSFITQVTFGGVCVVVRCLRSCFFVIRKMWMHLLNFLVNSLRRFRQGRKILSIEAHATVSHLQTQKLWENSGCGSYLRVCLLHWSHSTVIWRSSDLLMKVNWKVDNVQDERFADSMASWRVEALLWIVFISRYKNS